jgi:hypothetical protein
VALPAFYAGPDVTGMALEWSDVDAEGGRGASAFTLAPERAQRFPNAGAVMEEWKRQSTVRPLRHDGKPNRPLSAFTISPRRLEEWTATL